MIGDERQVTGANLEPSAPDAFVITIVRQPAATAIRMGCATSRAL